MVSNFSLKIKKMRYFVSTFRGTDQLTAEYINYYNNGRRQWDLKKMTPAQYRNHLLSLQVACKQLTLNSVY